MQSNEKISRKAFPSYKLLLLTLLALKLNHTEGVSSSRVKDLCWNQPDYTTFVYHEDCSKYLQCMLGEIKLKSCPDGWFYNSELKLCDDVHGEGGCFVGTKTLKDDSKSVCKDQPENTTLPYPEDCRRYYYCRGYGFNYLLSCPTNNYYDPISGNCGPPELVSPTACNDLPKSTTDAATTSKPSEKCVGQEEGITFPNEENCQQYIYCDGKGGDWLINCPYNTYFYPDSGDCAPSDDPDICLKDTITTEATTTDSLLNPGGQCVNQEIGVTFPNEENCHQYFYCNGKGGFWLINCPDDNYYDPDSGDCAPSDDPEICRKAINTTDATTTVEADNTSNPEEQCMDQEMGTTFPYEANCQQYIYCNGKGGFLLLNCPYNNYYYPDLGDCGASDDPEICRKATTTTQSSTEIGADTTVNPDEQCADQEIGTTFPYEQNCQKYIYCNGKGGFLLLNCPNNNYYHPDLGDCGPSDEPDICRKAATTTTISANTTLNPGGKCAEQEMGTTFPFEANCQQYIYCNGKGGFLLLNCPYNNYFYPDSGDCGPSNDPDICLRKSSTTEATTTDSQETTTTISSDTTLNPGEKCADQEMGTTFPYETNCRQYIFCNGQGGFLLLNCPYNNYYYPDSGDCGPSDDPEICRKATTTQSSTEIGADTTVNPDEQCEDQEKGTTFPYEENCQKYLYCNGKDGFLLLNCPNNNYYYPDSGDCGPSDDPEICRQAISTTEATTVFDADNTLNPEEQCANKEVGTTFPYEENCQKYIYCNGKGGFLLLKCPYNNYYYPDSGDCGPSEDPEICHKATITTDATTTVSQEATTTDTTLNPSQQCANQEMGITFPYEENCQKYIYCNGKGGFLLLNCPNNNYYYPDSGDCGPSKDPNICRQATTTIETITSTENPTTDDTAYNVCVDQPALTTFPYPEDCQRYYFCRGNNLFYLLSCPTNNYYDPMSGNCGPPELVSPTACKDLLVTTTEVTTISADTTLNPDEQCVNQEMGTTFPYEENCQKYIYCNGKGGFLLLNCPNNNYYYPDSGDCGPSDDSDICLKKSTTTEATTIISADSTLNPSHQCSDQEIGISFPNEENCHQYFYCNGKGGFLLLNCPNNNYYYPDSGNCGPSDDPDICQKKPTTTEATTTISADTTFNPEEQCVDQEMATTFPYEANCRQYIYCNGQGGFVLLNCPYNNYYYPDSGDCGPSDDPEICRKPITTTEPTTTISADTTLNPDEKCVNQEMGITFPYEENCQKYIYCNGKGGFLLMNCPTNNYYYPDSRDCGPSDDPEICRKATTTTEATTTISEDTTLNPSQQCANQEVGITFPYKENCQKYIYCNGKGGFLTLNCPNNNYYYPDTGDCGPSNDPNVCRQTTTTIETITSTEKTNPDNNVCVDQPAFTTFPYPEDCQRYYFCRGNDLYYLLSCPTNNYYDPISGNCGPPELVSPTACKTVLTTTTAATTPISPSKKCLDQMVGTTYPFEENCQQYIYCNGEKGFLLINCPYNNYYYPDSGDCGPSNDPNICLRKSSTTKALTTTPTELATESTLTSLLNPDFCSNNIGKLVQYPNNCRKYISCENPIPIAFHCKRNEYFSKEEQKCLPDFQFYCLGGSFDGAKVVRGIKALKF